MENELYRLYKARCSELVKDSNGLVNYSILGEYEYFKDLMSEDDFKVALRVKHNRNNKRNRTKNKLMDMIQYYMYAGARGRKLYMVFGTGTIDNEYLWKREPRTRDKLLNVHLLNNYDVALVNKDYGDKTEREHYHWIGLTNNNLIPKLDHNGNQLKSKKGKPLFELDTNDYKLGYNPTVESIVTTDMDKIRNYLLKLNNHSNKETARRLRHIKTCNYNIWELLENDKHQFEIKKRVIARRAREEKEDTKK